LLASLLALVLAYWNAQAYSVLSPGEFGDMKKGYDIKKTGLVPVYPEGYACSPLTSFYASWLDVDGTHRDEIHSGVDGGALGEWILAPAPGKVLAVWEADWQWGREGALLLVHTAKDLNLEGDGAPFYFTAYDHVKYSEISGLRVGQTIERGQPLARVYRPGGHARYLPEVHWEVWEARYESLRWVTNSHGGREWRNESARLIDPLYMLGIHNPPTDGKSVPIAPFEADRDYSSFRGFTYIFRCRKA
jgi:murein DD-endopeptidase MepM/ murein hydrolase activator NlpD